MGNIGASGKDPLELARAQLDFAEFTRSAPSVRDVLFKAQTMVPLAPGKPWWKLAASVGGALLLAAVLLAPWLPLQQRLGMLSLAFDKLYTRAEAQRLVDTALRNVHDEAVLAGAVFTPPAGGGDDARGLLTLHMTSHDRSPAQLKDIAAAINWDGAAQLAAGVGITSEAYVARDWQSPYQLAVGLFARQRHTLPALEPGRSLASDILNNQQLYASTLAEELLGGDPPVRLKELKFIEQRGPVLERRYDFEVPAWPAPLGVTVEHFVELSAQQQATLRQHVEEFAQRMNLAACSLQLASEPQLWQPVLVDVRSGAGISDRMLTARLQAWLNEPGAEQTLSSEDSISSMIGAAMEQVLPGRDFRIDYLRSGPPLPSGLRPYLTATITVEGQRSTSLLARERYSETDDPDW